MTADELWRVTQFVLAVEEAAKKFRVALEKGWDRSCVRLVPVAEGEPVDFKIDVETEALYLHSPSRDR